MRSLSRRAAPSSSAPRAALATTVVFVATIVLVGTGCSSKAPKPKMWPGDVRGVVSLDGKPLDGGAVTFIPEIPESEGGKPGIARIGADGGYAVGNSNKKEVPGLKPGDYRVVVLKLESPISNVKSPTPRLTIPEQYVDVRTTPLRARIKAGLNRVDFHLQSDAGPGASAERIESNARR